MLLFGKLISKADTIVKNPKDDVQHTSRCTILFETDPEFVVTVTDQALLPPNLLPGSVD
jgi:hypothetical protein